MNRILTIITTILILCSINLFSDTNFRVMSYNALNFDGNDRLSDFETVITVTAPDILICQEIESSSASNAILTILNSAFGGYSGASFVYDNGLHNMLYYKTSIATLVSQDVIDTSPRDVSEYVLNIDGNPIRFYSCHLKASQGYESERLAAVTILRDYLNGLSEGTEFMIVGDMNFYTSSEDGYQKFIANEAVNIGRAEDLCTRVGSWNTNPSYADVHTQSTRLTSVGGGASGGLDDKFDFIFGNYDINDGSGIEYSTGSFTPYGNDGDHFDQSINNGTNSAVSASIADALYNASDHLPVFADFVSLSGTQPSGSLIISEYIEGSSNNKAIEIYNGTGETVDLSAYSLEKDVNGDSVFANTYTYTGMLSHGEVFVLANPSSVSAILNEADATDGSLITFNGNDQVRLLKYGTEIDRVGISGGTDFAKDVTFVRKSTVTDPQSGEQDPRSNGEWDQYPQDTFEFLGNHSAINPSITVTSPIGSESWERGNLYDITWTSSDFTGNIKVELFKNSSGDYTELITSTENDSIWQWDIPIEQTMSSDYKIRVSDAVDGNPDDESDDFFSITGISSITNLFISEYIEGSSNNKALELFNGTGSPVDLSDYRLERCNNGAVWGSGILFTFEAGTWIIANDDVWVNVNSSAITGMQAQADSVGGELTYFNGDDSIGLFKTNGIGGWTLIDVIGENGVDPGSAWDVAGTSGATANHTLVRKSTVTSGNTSWSASAGTNTSDSEWIVYPEDTFDNLGLHSMGGNALPLISNIEQYPASDILSTTTVSISANVTDSDGIINLVELHWGLSSGILGTTTNMSNGGVGDIYSTIIDIPAHAAGTTIYYEIYAEDDGSESSVTLEYHYTVVGISSGTLPYSESFEADLGDCYTNNVSGVTKEWYWHSSGYAAMNGYNSGDTEEDWLILPAIDFDNYSTEVMSFDTWFNYGSDDSTNYLKLLYSSDYPGLGDPSGFTWSDLTFDHPASSSTWTTSGNIDLTTLTDTLVYIAFKYHYEVGEYRWWEIDNILIDGIGTIDSPINVSIIISGSSVTLSWNEVTGASLYYVYSSDNSHSGFVLDETGSFDGTSWTTSSSSGKKFYYVTAE